MQLTLVSPKRRFFSGLEIDRVTLPGHMGQLTVLPGHSPLITTLSTGVVRFKESGSDREHEFLVTWGYCEVGAKGIMILAETAETRDEVDVDRAKVALQKANENLKERKLSVSELEKYRRKAVRAKARIDFGRTTTSVTAQESSRLH